MGVTADQPVIQRKVFEFPSLQNLVFILVDFSVATPKNCANYFFRPRDNPRDESRKIWIPDVESSVHTVPVKNMECHPVLLEFILLHNLVAKLLVAVIRKVLLMVSGQIDCFFLFQYGE